MYTLLDTLKLKAVSQAAVFFIIYIYIYIYIYIEREREREGQTNMSDF